MSYLCAVIVLTLAILLFIENKHNAEFYIITYVYVKNNKINLFSNFRYCKSHKCYEYQSLTINIWYEYPPVIYNPIKYKGFFFQDKKILKEFKKLEKKFPINYDENRINKN